ncbi:hypothetical protein LOZ39_004266 [Ophidiomyces ophidiicola]|nr:hypothetical protein LOZ64_005106 [Ophidiomyces ophidiicola]KAI2036121.1 hypothetical protein LOZ45_000128 [Ophidiomyces ophidiicola]KAI2072652.1 hypothetical protein LOZ39_004266 [Ophidiomyces ophidiicola]KAI2141632.1 hypothetical protein LOZ28_002414 [Ophidiomyces ophidiicola]KAI2213404.1 hypothetical protein LOZ15_005105 [Ophidiomyces ophidiicola]
MSGFGTGSAFGGFGSSNQQQPQQQQNAGFGTGSGFGSTGGTGFGTGTSSSPFGTTGNTFGTSGGFGSGGGFGASNTQTNPIFGGQNKGFGNTSATGSTMFGSGTNAFGNTGFGTGGSFGGTGSNTGTGATMFGSTPANTQSTGFGAGTGGSIFGGGTSTTTGFGGSAGFGSGTALGGAVPPASGTANPPFNAFEEKEPSSSVTCHYQSISCMQPYQKYSFEELRAADYDQGRRYGNASGQAGAFGSAAFGGFQQPASGFGSQTSTPFGAASSAPSAFGQTASAGFGSTTSNNPLFGATKPATSLFGQAATSQPSAFGTTTSGSGGFGSTTGTAFGASGSTGTGGGFFNNQQNKTGFGTGGTGTGFGGFGQTATTSASPFGATTSTASPFGQPQQGGTSAFGGFGQQQNQQNKPAFGGFGATTQQQQQQPAGTGLFGGSNNTATPSFGTSLGQQGGSSIFGNTTGQNTTTGNLFGNQQQQEQKPNLFGSLGSGTTATGTNAFGGFGTQNQPQQTSSLFGGTNQQQQQKPSLFGTSTGQTSSLFNPQPNAVSASTGGSLFGLGGANQNIQQQQPGGLGIGSNSLFGGSQQQVQQQSQGAGFQASLLEGNPYGSQSIFSGLPAPNSPSPGPLATPLSASLKQKQRAPLPMYKISPSAANRLITPPTRQGYGFSYSTYGTPSSSIGSPAGLGNSLLSRSFNGGSLGRSFSKSLSANSLRRSFEPETDSILSPGAFAAGSSRYSSSNLKRLTIDRSLRTDLFTRSSLSPATITNGDSTPHQPSKLKKRVSFDSPIDNDKAISKTDGALVRIETETSEPTPAQLGFLRSSKDKAPACQPNGIKGSDVVNGLPDSGPSSSSSAPEMEEIKGKELVIVPGDREQQKPATPESSGVTKAKVDKPEIYWMKPSLEEVKRMTREQQKRVANLTVGRDEYGSVSFNAPVDLTTIDLNDLMGKIVNINLRSITVYPDEGIKPPQGKGLNVPSTLRIENSWPRGRENLAPIPANAIYFDKHVERLRRITNTEFVDYKWVGGVWTFKVPHFTTYGLDYDDDDDDDEGESHDQSTVGAHPDMVTPKAQTPHRPDSEFTTSAIGIDESFDDSTMGIEDDTFEFKKRGLFPGGFMNQVTGGRLDMSESDEERGSFLEERSVGSGSEQGYVEESDGHSTVTSEPELEKDETMHMAGAFPFLDYTTERSILPVSPQKSNLGRSQIESTGEMPLNLNGNWAEQLQRTISPRKQDREALREMQNNAFANRLDAENTPKAMPTETDKGFITSIDLMNSLFRPRESLRKAQVLKSQNGFEWPYIQKPKTFAGKPGDMSEADLSFHNSFKPRWATQDILALRNDHADVPDILLHKVEQWKEDLQPLILQKSLSSIKLVDGIPFANLTDADFLLFIGSIQGDSPESELERRVWQLAYILFVDDIQDDISAGVPDHLQKQYLHRIKKDRLGLLLETMIRQCHSDIENIPSPEERAIAFLCSHRVDDACRTLIESGNPHLATLVSQIGRDAIFQKDMKDQIDSWRSHNVLSEMTEPIRALYELIAGNCLRSEGKPNVPIEDRTSTFNISERFNLDWIQAFGLRLWYGIGENDPIEAAVALFNHDINKGGEPAFPSALRSHDSQKSKSYADLLKLESPLWVILKVFASSMSGGENPDIGPIRLPEDLMPEAVCGHALHHRLSFQLLHHIRKAMGGSRVLSVDDHCVDQLTLNYALEIASANEYGPAIFVLLHLSCAADREKGIKEMLCRFASWLPTPILENGSQSIMWKYLTEELRVPASWIWAAKALFARAKGNPSAEVEYLVNAEHWDEAHDTFCRIVAPRAIIQRDYATLKTIIDAFGKDPETNIRRWSHEGGMYQDFLLLVEVPGIRKDQTILKRLVGTLIHIGEKTDKIASTTFEEKIAFREIGRLVAGWCTNDTGNTVQPGDILRLPMTQNARRIHAVEVSRRYYRAIMAGGA